MSVLKKFHPKLRTIAMHILAWTIYISIGATRKYGVKREPFDLLDLFLTEIPIWYVFYMNYYILSKYLSAKRYLEVIALEILLYLSTTLLYHCLGYYISPIVNPKAYVPHIPFTNEMIDTLWVYIIYAYFSYGYYYARQSVIHEKKLRMMEREKLSMEKDKLKSEYAFLRAQINPHFLHNTLNLFYAKSLPISEELSDSILTLCEIMRYSLSTSENEGDTVPLAKEIEHVQNVIKINQLRFSNRLQVVFEIIGDIGKLQIIPLVIITLVENAFKHGELNNEQQPLVMQLKVSEEEGTIYFSTQNKKKTGPKELSHGIGMDNIKRRLQAVYKDHYALIVIDEGDNYAVNLWIAAS